MKIMIDSISVKTKSGTSQRTQKPYSIREQEAWLDTGKRFPAPIKLNLDNDQAPWPVGEYTVNDDESHYADKFGTFSASSNPVLVPVAKK